MTARWAALTASVRGFVHERDGRPNQDAVRIHPPERAGDILCLAVADGHGSARSFRSARGSALAAECALRQVHGFFRRSGSTPSFSRLRRQLAGKWPGAIVADWRRAVRADVAKNPFTALEFAPFPEPPPIAKPGRDLPFHAYLAYGTTLVFFVVSPQYLLYAQLGDGDILTIRGDGRISRPWPRGHAFRASETVSLCSHQADRRFQTRVESLRGDSPPALILLSTDGYANCFGDDAAFFQVGTDLLEYLREGGPDFVGERLEQWLHESSRNGSGDDITVGLAVRLNALRSAS